MKILTFLKSRATSKEFRRILSFRYHVLPKPKISLTKIHKFTSIYSTLVFHVSRKRCKMLSKVTLGGCPYQRHIWFHALPRTVRKPRCISTPADLPLLGQQEKNNMSQVFRPPKINPLKFSFGIFWSQA